jgi:hypothetical protein
VAVIGGEAAISLRLLDRVEIGALDVLDQRDLERLGLAELAHDSGDLVEVCPLRGSPAPLAGDDLEAVAVGADHDRLDDSALLDRGGELRQCGLVEGAPGLAGVRLNARSGDHLNAAAAAAAGYGCLLGRLAEQRGQAAAEALRAFARLLVHAASACRAAGSAVTRQGHIGFRS